MQIPCKICGQQMTVPELKWEIMNGIGNSLIVLHHTSEIKCLCGAEYLPAIMGFQHAGINVALVPKPQQQEQSRIIMPGSGVPQ